MEKNPQEERVLYARPGELEQIVEEHSSQGWTVVALTTDPGEGKITVLLSRPIKHDRRQAEQQ